MPVPAKAWHPHRGRAQWHKRHSQRCECPYREGWHDQGIEDQASPSFWPSVDALAFYGDSNDLWGQTWAAADINSSGFGVAIAAQRAIGPKPAAVDHIQITVYYTETADENRVCFATRSVELCTDGCFRQRPTEEVWGRLAPKAHCPTPPAAGMENRKLRVMVVPSQGDFDELPDSGTNKVKLQVLYRPAYAYAPKGG